MVKHVLNAISFYFESYRGLSRDVWYLSLLTLINRSGTIVMLFLSIYMIEKLGLSKGQATIVLSFAGVGSFIGAYLGGVLTDKVGYYKVMFTSLFCTGILFFILMFITDFVSLCFGFALLGIIGDAYRPASASSFSVYETAENQTRALSLYRLAINLGFVLGSAGAGFIAGSIGYIWLFIIDGMTCILAAFFLLATLKNKEDLVSKEKTEQIGNGRSPYTDIWYLMFLFSLFLAGLAFFQLFHTFPVYCREILNLSEEGIGGYMAYNGLLIALLEMPMIFLIVKCKKEIPAVIFGAALFGLSFLALVLGTHWSVIILFMTIIVIGEILNFPLTYKMALNRSTAKTRGQYMGMFSMMYSLVHIMAPYGLKFSGDYGFDELWYLCAILCGLSTLGLFLLRKSA